MGMAWKRSEPRLNKDADQQRLRGLGFFSEVGGEDGTVAGMARRLEGMGREKRQSVKMKGKSRPAPRTFGHDALRPLRVLSGMLPCL